MAAKTVAEYTAHMKHAIGGDPDSRITLLDVLNEALRYLFDHHAWNFRERPILAVSSVASQSYLSLPADFGELVSATNGLRQVQLTSMEDIAHRRGNTALPTPLAAVYAALSFPAQSSVTLSAPVPRLELYPTPNAIDTYSIEYRAGALTMTATTDVPNIPLSYERALVLLARAFISDYEEQDATHEWEQANVELAKLMEHDAMTQQNLGMIEGGAVSEGRKIVNFTMGSIRR